GGRPRPGKATKKSRSRSVWSDARCTSMKPPAPGPVSGLSATHETKAAAMHASTALPPSARISAPACAVSGCPPATAPFMRRGYSERRGRLGGAEEAGGLERVVGVGHRYGPARAGRAEPAPATEAGGDHCHPDLAREALVDRGAKDDVRLLGGR